MSGAGESDKKRRRLVKVTLDEGSIGRSSADIEHERAVAIYDLLEDNSFAPLDHDGGDGISILESRAPFRHSPPLHVHHTEDEVFHLLEGEMVLLVDGATRRVHAGETHLAPKGVPHTYRVMSDRARWLLALDHEADSVALPTPLRLTCCAHAVIVATCPG